MTIELPQFYYSDVYNDMSEAGYDYKDNLGFNGYVDPVLRLLDKAKELTDDQVFELLDAGKRAVQAFSSEDLYQNIYWGLHHVHGTPVMGTSSYAIYLADDTGRGVFLDDYMWSDATHPLLEGVGWYYNPLKWAICALTVQDLVGIAPQWTVDHYNFMTLPWRDVIGPISTVGGQHLLYKKQSEVKYNGYGSLAEAPTHTSGGTPVVGWA